MKKVGKTSEQIFYIESPEEEMMSYQKQPVQSIKPVMSSSIEKQDADDYFEVEELNDIKVAENGQDSDDEYDEYLDRL